jgi:hypothetical protein
MKGELQMAKYDVDLSSWIVVEASSEEEAFAIGHDAIDKIRNLIPEFDGEVAGVSEWED